MKAQNRLLPMNITKVKPKAFTNARDANCHFFLPTRNSTVEPGGLAFGNRFQKKLSKLGPIGKLFIPGRKFTVPAAAATKDTSLTMAHSRLDYVIALIPRH